jgi:Na+/H+ antiporter
MREDVRDRPPIALAGVVAATALGGCGTNGASDSGTGTAITHLASGGVAVTEDVNIRDTVLGREWPGMPGSDADFGLLVALLVIALPLVALAKRVNISYPIVLVLSGLALGFVPQLPRVRLDPNVVLLIFLPPLLYWEAITASTDVMLENAGQIVLLAVGLVILTTIAVAVIAHAFIPDMPWAVAFVLGAIVSPTDELAAVPVLERFKLPRHVLAIVGGESLLNDATALVIYAVAVTATATGVFRVGHTLLQFVITVIGSIAIGFISGRIAVALWSWIKDRQLQGVISVIVPFLAYFPATHFDLSGVLAVVVAGSYVNHFTPRVLTPASRTQIIGFWNTVVFIANAVLFLVVGLQLHDVAQAAFQSETWQTVAGAALVVNVAIIIVRLIFVVAAEYAPTAAPADHAAPDWKNALIVGWSGLRGAVSLAAALAIPIMLPNGTRFPHRDLIVFTTFTVILVTLVLGGLTLPVIVKALRIVGDTEERDEFRLAVLRSSEAALTRIDELEREHRIDAPHAATLRKQYEHKRDIQVNHDDAEQAAEHARHADAEREVIAAQRKALIALRERGEIDNVVLRRVQQTLDLAASRLALEGDAS